MIDYAVIDTETTMKCRVGNNKAHPAHPDNYPAAVGVRCNGANKIYRCVGRTHHGMDTILPTLPKFWVGHNLKFDLLHLMGLEDVSLPVGLQVWDTQLAEYILTGQRTQWAKLDDLAVKYGGTLKDDRLKTFFEKGLGADEIPTTILYPYLEGDLKNTDIVFQAQIVQAVENGQLGLIMAMMDALLCTTVMQYHGMCVDVMYVDDAIIKLKDVEEKLLNDYVNLLAGSSLPSEHLDFFAQIDSPKALSMLFFGGTLKKKEPTPVGHYKDGRVKTRLGEKECVLTGLCTNTPAAHGADLNKLKYYTTDDDVLKSIELLDRGHASKLAAVIRAYRLNSKQLTTYFTRLDELTIHGYVYPNLNHCSTITGRLSSTEPNMQNQTNGPIKKAFVSRFENGKLLDIDYNQLEMVGLAYVSGDKQLKDDLNAGIDLHNALYCSMYGRIPTKEERKPFKSRSFALVYGAGAKTIADNSGCTLPEAKKFINTFYERYSGVYKFHLDVVNAADADSYATPEMTDGHQIREYVLKSKTGRRYVYKSYLNDRKDWNTGKTTKEMTFSPTELKNYPVQGFSTGDVVPLVLGKIYRWWENLPTHARSGILPVLTVHDSIVFDVRDDMVELATTKIPELMCDVGNHLKDLDITDWDVKIRVGVSVGDNWLDVKETAVISS